MVSGMCPSQNIGVIATSGLHLSVVIVYAAHQYQAEVFRKVMWDDTESSLQWLHCHQSAALN